MRSRYSAFATGDESYLLATHHASARPSPAELRASMQGCQWLSLTIRAAKDGRAGQLFGEVSFVARYQQGGEVGELRERSQFIFADGRWFYLTGQPF